ncbi:hypothetical protein IQ268_06245 [Oculatella sp. LEGE 06141]|uniref:hypothetical protein n=1 Tax=Oculatella sp. LEGE 06141 TaxID=1828648 RepID=UPI0018817316|nr:hypothetical protein [Oculatella sp. LEGE 06141]MBE9178184.1 hypothetical protein [Oculatella sp. LEGE 06141]
MPQRKLDNKAYLGLIGAACSSLVLGLPAVIQPAAAQTETPQAEAFRNPCPQIYYEEPFNTNTLVPAGCAPNSISSQLGFDQTTVPTGVILGNPDGTPNTAIGGITPAESYSPLQAQPPLPSVQGASIATVSPIAGAVNVRLVNTTNAAITYEVIGDTQPRMLMGGEETMLTNLSLPTTITAVRQDGGLLDLSPSSFEQGMLEISLGENTSFDETQGVLQIQGDGQVFVN